MFSAMEKIQTNILYSETVKRIRKLILDGSLGSGEKINEQVLSDKMGVSRTPIREALRTLNSEGLIELIPRRGAFVAQFSDADIREMFEVMSGLEALCIRLAMPKLSDVDIEKLEKLHSDMEALYTQRDHKAYLKVNWKIHDYIQNLADNKLLNGIINDLRKKVVLLRQRQLYQPGRFSRSIQEHREILAAIKSRDSAAAEEAMANHLLRQGQSLVGELHEEPIGEEVEWS